MQLVNLTPYRVVLAAEGGEVTLEAAAVPARSRLVVEAGGDVTLDGVTLRTITFRQRVDGLPDPHPGLAYLVLSGVAFAAQAAGRAVDDLFLLGPGPQRQATGGTVTLTTLVRLGAPEYRR